MDVLHEPQTWGEQTFGSAKLGDQRRTRRLVTSAAKIADQPEKSFTQVFDWNELRGFYRLCNQSEATLAAIMEPHWEQTRHVMGQQPLVLILHDTSELDFSSHHHLTGIGPVGNESGQGFLQHNSLAVLPQLRHVLGLAYQQLKVRQPATKGESSYQRKRRSRESDMWREGFRGSGHCPEGCCWVDVCDRGCDDYEAMRVCRELGHHFLFRACQNRLVFVTLERDRQEHLLDYARSLPALGGDVVEIPGRGQRLPRTADVSLAAAAVEVPAPVGTSKRSQQPCLAAWVIRIWEPQPPVEVTEPLELILVCSLPTTTVEQIKQRRATFVCVKRSGARDSVGGLAYPYYSRAHVLA